jgi:hypothetical protein
MMIDAPVALASETMEQEKSFMNNPFPKFDTEQEIVRLKFRLIED